jgi:uncharacterized surface anchored protein
MSSISNAPKAKGKKAELGSKLEKYGFALWLSGLLFGGFCTGQVRDLGQIQDNLKAAKAEITKKADKNPLAENTNQPASLNRSSGDTSQVPSTVAESYLSAAEEAMRQKINFFRVAENFFYFVRTLGLALMAVGFWFSLENQQEGRKE